MYGFNGTQCEIRKLLMDIPLWNMYTTLRLQISAGTNFSKFREQLQIPLKMVQ